MKLTTALRTMDDSSEASGEDPSSSSVDYRRTDSVNDSLHSNNSSSSSTNPLSHSHHDESNRAMREVKEIAETETRRMRCWRFVILLSILCTGAGICTVAYLFLTNKQESDFESQVRNILRHKGKVAVHKRNLIRKSLLLVLVLSLREHDCRNFLLSVSVGEPGFRVACRRNHSVQSHAKRQ